MVFKLHRSENPHEEEMFRGAAQCFTFLADEHARSSIGPADIEGVNEALNYLKDNFGHPYVVSALGDLGLAQRTVEDAKRSLTDMLAKADACLKSPNSKSARVLVEFFGHLSLRYHVGTGAVAAYEDAIDRRMGKHY